jgi:glycosyltransferase involved in cell wall biosynthesis
VRCRRNEGKGNALICGTAYSKGEYVAFLDADMDLHPEQLESFFTIMKSSGADVVIGSKFHPLSKVDYPRLRRVYSFFYFMLVRSLFGLPVRDTQTGIKLFKREVLERVLPRVLVKRFAFDLELLANVHHFGYRIVEAPVVVNFNRVCSRLHLPAVWNVFVDTLAIFYRMRILRYYDRPERLRAKSLSLSRSESKRGWSEVPRWRSCCQGSVMRWPAVRFCAACGATRGPSTP